MVSGTTKYLGLENNNLLLVNIGHRDDTQRACTVFPKCLQTTDLSKQYVTVLVRYEPTKKIISN